MDTPRIGLTTYGEQVSFGVWATHADVLHSSYSSAVRAAGGVPLLLPPGGTEGEAAVALSGVDGLLLSGGADIDPARYGADPDPRTGEPRPDRDGYELALLQEALRLDLPVFAICRGMQLLNVALGGTLTQHLPDLVGHDEHCAERGVMGRHAVRYQPGSRVAAMMGEATDVAAYHHQAVAELGEGLDAVAWAADGVVEAVELPSKTWVIGVQWHPESDRLGSLFDDFVAASRQRARSAA